jgi:hypothetical protein
MPIQTRLLRTADGYDVRHVDGALIHLGMVRRDGRRWVATRPGALVLARYARRRDAVAYLTTAITRSV